jgi:hypothetical protein
MSVGIRAFECMIGDGIGFSFLIKFYELLYVIFVGFRFGETQGFFKCVSDHVHIPVFTKYQWQHHPVVGGSYLAISAVISGERFSFPSRYIGCIPGIGFGFSGEISTTYVLRCVFRWRHRKK